MSPVVAKSEKPAYIRAMLTGSPGTGKTLFPSSLPSLYLDLEGRAGHTGRPRLLFTKDANGIQDIQNTVNLLARLKPDEKGMLTYTQQGTEPIEFNTLVIDSLDEIQVMMDIGWPKTGDMRRWWGRALTVMQNIITSAKTVNAHLFVISHAKEYMPDEAQQKTGVFVPEVKLALSGQIRDRAPRWFDTILHMMPDPTAKNRVGILTQPQAIGGRYYLAKDATHIFGGKNLTVRFENGKPNPADVQAMVDATDSGGDVSMFINPEAVYAQAEEEAAVRLSEAEEAFNPALISTYDELFAQAAHRIARYDSIEAVKEAMRDMTAAEDEASSKAILRRFNFSQWWQKLIHWVPSDGRGDGVDGTEKPEPEPEPDPDPRGKVPDLKAQDDDTGADPDVGDEAEEAEADKELPDQDEEEGKAIEEALEDKAQNAVRLALLEPLPVTTKLYQQGTKLADIMLQHEGGNHVMTLKDVLVGLRDWDTNKPENQPVKKAAAVILANWDEARAELSTPHLVKRPISTLPPIAPSDWEGFATFATDALGFLTKYHFLTVVEAVEEDKGRSLRNSRGRKQVWEGVHSRWIPADAEVAIAARPGSELDKALGRKLPAETEEEALQAAGL